MPDRVLLTGISGFLGGHIALQLLAAGFIVRGSVRDSAKGDKIRTALADAGADLSRLEFVTLDLTADAGWADAMSGIRYLQHTASPFVVRQPKDRNQLIRPAVEGTTRAVTAALRANVERIVVTSSVAAVVYGHDRSRTAPFTAADWTNLSRPGVNAYTESKTRAERKAWELVDAANRHKDLVAINPAAILGPLLDDDPGTSAALVARLLDGSVPAAPRLGFGVIDVRDVAALHVAAMLDPEAGGQRFPCAEGHYMLLDLAATLRSAVPERANKVPRLLLPDWVVRLYALFDRDLRGNAGELGTVRRADSTAARKLLGRDFISGEESLTATARSLLARGLA